MATGRKTILLQKSVANLSTIRQHGLEVDFTGVEEMDNGSYVNFVLEVKKDGITWEIRKRYSEFRFFQQALAEHTHHLSSEFPPKNVIFNFTIYSLYFTLLNLLYSIYFLLLT